jgi:hypothetical protein
MRAGLVLAGLTCLLTAAPAAAAAPTDSPILIRSLSAGTASAPAAEYVMLQLTADGQGDLDGEELVFHGPGGEVSRRYAIPADVANGESQRKVLLATQQAAAAGGFPSPDFDLGEAASLDPAGGAVCVVGRYPADCIAWGSFPDDLLPALPNPQKGKAQPILSPALGRTIDAGCSTWLGPDDDLDTGSQFHDGVSVPPFGEPSPPPPENNAAAVSGSPCPVETLFNETPANPTNDTTPTFAFGEVPPEYGTDYMCSFAGSPFAQCAAAGSTYGPLPDGVYDFRVYAVAEAGADPTPAEWTFEVDTVPPETFVTSSPGPVSSGFSASFAFASSEHDPTFVCRLDNGPKQPCEPGKTFFFLSAGLHVFRVWSSDQATNQDPTPAEHVFSVDPSFGDTTPPFTEIVSGPPRRTKLTSARFTYTSNEPGSRFECRLDGEPFGSCDAGGNTYPALRNGRHVFEVRAVDRAGNVDATPDPYVWVIDGAAPETTIDRAPPGVTRTAKRRAVVSFSFSSSRPRPRFSCRLDKGRYLPCTSPWRVRAGIGRHRFEVYATDALGNVDPSPARRFFRIVRKGAGGFFGRRGGR